MPEKPPEPEHQAEPGDLYVHRNTEAWVIVLSYRDGGDSVRLGRTNVGRNNMTTMTLTLEVFRIKYRWSGKNILTERERHAFGVDAGQDPTPDVG